ncbi:MAG: hypothetical protein L6Q76_21505 [Polyangiaceae bacterium]|nr:hypothetical protein [Polyangiaceae bacterium]
MKALPPITLEQLAEVTARIDTGTPREEALREAGVPAEMWDLAQQTWAALMTEESEHQKHSLRARFAELLAEYRAKALDERKARKPLEEPALTAIMAVPEDTDGSGTLPIPGQARPRGKRAPSPSERPPGVVASDQKRTVALPAMPDLAPSPLPFSPPPQLTLAQYARVCVELWKDPARSAEICARYGIPDADAWAAVNQLWQERLSRDPTLKQRWIKLTERMRTPRAQD